MPEDLGTDLSDPAAVRDTLDAHLGRARTWADPDTPLPRHLASWDPVIAGLVAAEAATSKHAPPLGSTSRSARALPARPSRAGQASRRMTTIAVTARRAAARST